MKKMSTKKSLSLAALLSLGLAFGAVHTSLAQNDTTAPAAPPAHAAMMNGQKMPQFDPAMQKAHDKFLTETTELRKLQMEKRIQLRAIMQSSQPDDAKASQLAGELFDLQEQILEYF